MSGWKIVLIVIAVICGLLLCVCAGLGVFVYQAAQGPSDIRVRLECPTQVQVGEDFRITVFVENTASQSQTINSIDIYESYLEGVAIHDTRPRTSSESSMFGMRTYMLEKEILPGDEVAVKFDATATQPGNFTGDIDICINNQFTFTTRVLHTVVNE